MRYGFWRKEAKLRPLYDIDDFTGHNEVGNPTEKCTKLLASSTTVLYSGKIDGNFVVIGPRNIR